MWVPYRLVASYFAPDARQPVNQALVWVHDPDRLDVTLEQARTASFGIGGLVFATRDAVRIQIDQAAGIVIALLVAFSLVALAGAVVMLAASSRVEVERRIESFALLRALGASPRAIVAATAAEAMLVALPAAVLGLLVGTLAARGPADRLLEALDQFPAGWSLLGPLAICLCVVVGVVAAAACWPAWRACRRPVASMLRGGVSGSTPRGRGLPAGAVGLGMRMVVSRPVRTLATAAVLAASCAVILLMLALATTLDSLENDPGVLGKRYQLTARGSASTLDAVSAVPGVGAAAQRFSADVADSYQLGESFQLIAYCGDRLRFEAPQLAAGRRATRPGEAEVGQGLASALGLQPGTPLVTQFANGGEARFRVVGIVRAFDNDGRIAYVQPGARICDAGGGTTVVQLTDGASRSDVAAALARAGFPTATVGGVTTRNAQFLGVLAALLRTIAIIDGLVCLYAVVQMLALTAYERRSSIALIRACGADTAQVAAVFAGAALVVAADRRARGDRRPSARCSARRPPTWPRRTRPSHSPPRRATSPPSSPASWWSALPRRRGSDGRPCATRSSGCCAMSSVIEGRGTGRRCDRPASPPRRWPVPPGSRGRTAGGRPPPAASRDRRSASTSARPRRRRPSATS